MGSSNNYLINYLNNVCLNEEYKFLGFCELVSECGIGVTLKSPHGEVDAVALVLRKMCEGWGDEELTTKEKCWVLMAKGSDDFSYYKLFSSESSAIEEADFYIKFKNVLDPWDEDKKWNCQN